jgi:biopolymer transport protein ExbD
MLETASPLKQTLLHSPIGQSSALRPSQRRARRTMFASLMLTSLVDAFSILVIFLIMNTSASQESLDVDMQRLALPKATSSELIMEGVTVRVDNNRFLVDKKPVARGQLVAVLKQIYATSSEAKKDGLIIVADKSLGYEELNPVLLAGSKAGFSKFKFAVIRGEKN